MKAKRLLSIALVLTMILSLCSVTALADTSKYLEFDGVFTLGDSNAMGYGLPGYKGGEVDENGTLISGTAYTNSDYLHCVHGSFQDVVRQGLGLDWEQTWSMNYPALRINDALFYLDALDADYYHEMAYSYRVVNVDRDAYGENFVYDPTGTVVDNASSVFIDRVQEFDHPLIINQLCNADVFYSIIELAIDKISEVGTDNIPLLVEEVTTVFAEKHAEFRENYPLLIQRLQELSPNGVIVLVGLFNPMKDLVTVDEGIVPVFNALRPMFDIVNADIEAFAEEYGCLYANVDNTETLTIVNDVSVEDIINGFDTEKVYHGSPEGYAYMGRQILKQVEAEKSDISTSITVDLGRVKNVTAVLLDGKSVSDWSYEVSSRELTVPCLRTNAKSLTVTEVCEDGVYVAVYTLDWNSKDGYSAYQQYATLDAAASVTKVIKTVSSSITSVVKSVSSLFKSAFGKGK